MPSEKILAQKQQTVSGLVELLKGASAGVLVDYKGINVEDDTIMRRELREAGVKYSVEKNSILKFAVKEAGYEELSEVLAGTTALAISSEDQLSAPRIIVKYAEKLKGDFFNVKAGFMDGKVIDVATVNELAHIPSKEVLISKMLGSLNASIANFAIVIDQIAKKTEEGGAPAEAVAEEKPAEVEAAAETEAAPESAEVKEEAVAEETKEESAE